MKSNIFRRLVFVLSALLLVTPLTAKAQRTQPTVPARATVESIFDLTPIAKPNCPFPIDIGGGTTFCPEWPPKNSCAVVDNGGLLLICQPFKPDGLCNFQYVDKYCSPLGECCTLFRSEGTCSNPCSHITVGASTDCGKVQACLKDGKVESLCGDFDLREKWLTDLKGHCQLLNGKCCGEVETTINGEKLRCCLDEQGKLTCNYAGCTIDWDPGGVCKAGLKCTLGADISVGVDVYQKPTGGIGGDIQLECGPGFKLVYNSETKMFQCVIAIDY